MATGSVAAIALEREEGAEHQKRDGRRDDQARALTKPGRERGEPGWEKDSYKTTEDGEPARSVTSTAAAAPEIVSAHNGKPGDE